MPTKKDRLAIEEKIVTQYNAENNRQAKKMSLHVGSADSYHEFDMFEKVYVIGGVTTSPWKNATGSSNTAGKDRVSAELLWLTLWKGDEERIIIMTDEEMAKKMYNMWHGCDFPVKIHVIHYRLDTTEFRSIGVL